MKCFQLLALKSLPLEIHSDDEFRIWETKCREASFIKNLQYQLTPLSTNCYCVECWLVWPEHLKPYQRCLLFDLHDMLITLHSIDLDHPIDSVPPIYMFQNDILIWYQHRARMSAKYLSFVDPVVVSSLTISELLHRRNRTVLQHCVSSYDGIIGMPLYCHEMEVESISSAGLAQRALPRTTQQVEAESNNNNDDTDSGLSANYSTDSFCIGPGLLPRGTLFHNYYFDPFQWRTFEIPSQVGCSGGLIYGRYGSGKTTYLKSHFERQPGTTVWITNQVPPNSQTVWCKPGDVPVDLSNRTRSANTHELIVIHSDLLPRIWKRVIDEMFEMTHLVIDQFEEVGKKRSLNKMLIALESRMVRPALWLIGSNMTLPLLIKAKLFLGCSELSMKQFMMNGAALLNRSIERKMFTVRQPMWKDIPESQLWLAIQEQIRQPYQIEPLMDLLFQLDARCPQNEHDLLQRLFSLANGKRAGSNQIYHRLPDYQLLNQDGIEMVQSLGNCAICMELCGANRYPTRNEACSHYLCYDCMYHQNMKSGQCPFCRALYRSEFYRAPIQTPHGLDQEMVSTQITKRGEEWPVQMIRDQARVNCLWMLSQHEPVVLIFSHYDLVLDDLAKQMVLSYPTAKVERHHSFSGHRSNLEDSKATILLANICDISQLKHLIVSRVILLDVRPNIRFLKQWYYYFPHAEHWIFLDNHSVSKHTYQSANLKEPFQRPPISSKSILQQLVSE